jgi:hypothetical protein
MDPRPNIVLVHPTPTSPPLEDAVVPQAAQIAETTLKVRRNDRA